MSTSFLSCRCNGFMHLAVMVRLMIAHFTASGLISHVSQKIVFTSP